MAAYGIFRLHGYGNVSDTVWFSQHRGQLIWRSDPDSIFSQDRFYEKSGGGWVEDGGKIYDVDSLRSWPGRGGGSLEHSVPLC